MGPVELPRSLVAGLGRSGPLEGPWPALACAGALAASVALATLRGHRRRRAGRRPSLLRRLALGGWLATLVVLGLLAALNAYVGYVPTLAVTALADPPGGSRVDTIQIPAPQLGVRAAEALVYLPPGYADPANAGRRYPVVYLLHGYPGGAEDWFRSGRAAQTMDALLARHLVRPMILVAPSASGRWDHDSEALDQVGGPQVQTYLTSTVVRAIDAKYRTIPERWARAVGGMSSGGYGALNLGLRHQQVFSVILAEMPYGDPGDVTARLLGGRRSAWLANAPDRYIPTMTFSSPMAAYLIAGAADPTLATARRLAAMLDRRGQDAVFQALPGAGHTWRGARAELPFALVFASRAFAHPALI